MPLESSSSLESTATTSEPARQSAWQWLMLDGLIVALIAGAFFLPWLMGGRKLNAFVERYRPLVDGETRLTVEYDGQEQVKQWSSTNVRLLAAGQALTSGLTSLQLQEITALFTPATGKALPSDQLAARIAAAGQIFEHRTRRLTNNGAVDESSTILARTPRGDYLVGATDVRHKREMLYSPPLLVFPADLRAGDSHQQSGQRHLGSQVQRYEYSLQIVGASLFENETGRYPQALQVKTELRIHTGTDQPIQHSFVEWYVPQRGSIEWRSFDATGKVTTRVLSLDGPQWPAEAVFPSQSAQPADPSGGSDYTAWRLSPVAQLPSGISQATATIGPTFLPSTPPTLLAAAQDGDLQAWHVVDGAATLAWNWHPPATLLTPPCWDAARQRVYVGGADKCLHAIDLRGLLIWSWRAEDCLSARPALADERVFVGSEAGQLTAIDAERGSVLWQTRVGGPIVSAPVVMNELVIFGSDDGNVYALHTQTGKHAWSVSCGGPVESPIAGDATNVYAINNSGELHALDLRTGAIRWSVALDGTCSGELAVGADRVALVIDGALVTVASSSGHTLWSSAPLKLRGSPVVDRHAILVVDVHGAVRQFDFDGRVQQIWQPEGHPSPTESAATFRRGLAAGSAVGWLADSRGEIWRWGPHPTGPRRLHLKWTKRSSHLPFGSSPFSATPVIHGDQLVVVDDMKQLYRVEPKTGHAQRLAQITGTDGRVSADMVVADDLLVANVGATLHAIDLAQGKVRWQSRRGGVAFRPVVILGERTFGITQHAEDRADGSAGTLYALDTPSGEVRWERSLPTFLAPGGVECAGERLYISTPPSALSQRDGSVLWESKLAALGGPALDTQRARLYVGTADAMTGIGTLACLNSADGAVIWNQPLGTTLLHPMERPWLSQDRVIVPLWSGEIAALDAQTGSIAWRHQPIVARRGGVTVDNGRVWFMQQNSELVGLAIDTGERIAHYALDVELRDTSGFAPRPIVFHNTVVAPLSHVLLGCEVPR